MFQSHLPTHFLSYAIKHVVYLINRVLSPIIGNKTPFELLFKKSPDVININNESNETRISIFDK